MKCACKPGLIYGNVELTARRPYLLRAFYEWLLDNQLTPHLVVDINLPAYRCRWSTLVTDRLS